MIAVIADDFTGAAELAGIGLRFNLSVQLFTDATAVATGSADIIVLSTDSRSMNKSDAIQATQKAVEALLQINPIRIYKKTDSVLRGHVIDELRKQMQVQALHKTLLLPANPSLGRTIVNGNYCIDHVLIHETNFASDPEFGITDSDIKTMLQANGDDEVRVLEHGDTLPNKGIVVGQAATKEDVQAWLARTESNWLIAGAGDSFEALLENLGHVRQANNQVELLQPHLYISGTAFNKAAELIKSIQSKTNCVHYLSPAIMQQQDDEQWYQQVAATIQQQKKAVVAIDQSATQPANNTALSLRNAMAKAVKKIIAHNNIPELLIEGGSTAAAILSAMQLYGFTPTNELSRGVIRMKANGLFITVKPGSYELAKQIKQLYQS